MRLVNNNNNNNNFSVSNIRVSNRTLIYNVCPEAANHLIHLVYRFWVDNMEYYACVPSELCILSKHYRPTCLRCHLRHMHQLCLLARYNEIELSLTLYAMFLNCLI